MNGPDWRQRFSEWQTSNHSNSNNRAAKAVRHAQGAEAGGIAEEIEETVARGEIVAIEVSVEALAAIAVDRASKDRRR